MNELAPLLGLIICLNLCALAAAVLAVALNVRGYQNMSGTLAELRTDLVGAVAEQNALISTLVADINVENVNAGNAATILARLIEAGTFDTQAIAEMKAAVGALHASNAKISAANKSIEMGTATLIAALPPGTAFIPATPQPAPAAPAPEPAAAVAPDPAAGAPATP